MRSFLCLAVLVILAAIHTQGRGVYRHYRRLSVSAAKGCNSLSVGDSLGVCYKLLSNGRQTILQCPLGKRFNRWSCTCDIAFPTDPRRAGRYFCPQGRPVADARATAVAKAFANGVGTARTRPNALANGVVHTNTQTTAGTSTDHALAVARARAQAAAQSTSGLTPPGVANTATSQTQAQAITRSLGISPTNGSNIRAGGNGNALTPTNGNDGSSSGPVFQLDDLVENGFDDVFGDIADDDGISRDDDFDDYFEDFFDDLFDGDIDDTGNRNQRSRDDFYDDLLEDIFDNDGYDDIFDNDKYAFLFKTDDKRDDGADRNEGNFDNSFSL